MIRWRPILAGLMVFVTAGIAASVVWPALTHPRAQPTWVSGTPAPLSIEDVTAVPMDAPSASPSVAPVSDQNERGQWNDAGLTAALRRYDGGKNVDLAMMVMDRRTGRTFAYRAQEQFQTASVVKVDILATLLLQAERSQRALTASEQSLSAAMIEESDNAAADQLWKRIGGLSQAVDVFGLTTTAPGAGGGWGTATTTALDQSRLINVLAGPASPVKNSAYVFDLMRNVDDSQVWGVSAAAGPDETVALKNGWMPSDADDGRWVVNSMGRITGSGTDVTIVVLSHGHANLKAGVSMVEEVAKLARKYLGW